MKILSLRLKNLASLAGEHFIDFESQPLAAAGLIAIVGKTGAGKSTILDAMCLALFDKMPRFKHSDAKLTDADGSSISTTFTSTILRRGTVSGFAELHFQAQDQKVYAARWEVKRSYNKATGKLQPASRTLTCISDGTVLATKTTPFEAAIQRLTQLSFKQFTRAVLLAQSDVTAFLNARDEERGELLEYLTNSEIFAKIGHLAFEKTKAVRQQRETLETRLGDIEILSEEQFDELKAQLKAADASYLNLLTEKKQLDLQQLWFERLHHFQAEITAKQLRFSSEEASLKALEPEKLHLRRLERFSEIRPSVYQQQKIFDTEQRLQPQIQQQQKLFNQLNQQFETEKLKFKAAETAFNTQQQFEQTHAGALSEVRKCVQERDFIGNDYKKIQSRFNALEQAQQPLLAQKTVLEQQKQQTEQQHTHLLLQLESSQHFSSLDSGLTAHLQQLQQFIQHYQNIEQQLGNQAQAEQQLAAFISQREQNIQALGSADQLENQITQARLQRERKLNALGQLNAIQQNTEQLFTLKAEAAAQQSALEIIQPAQLQHAQNVAKAEQDFYTAKTEHLKLQEILQQQRLLHAENIEHLRSELKNGEACLVCGSTSHPYKTDDTAISKALFALHEQQEQQALAKEQDAFNTWQLAQQQLANHTAELEQLNIAIQQTADKIRNIEKSLSQQAEAAQLKLNFSQTPAEITAHIAQQQQSYQAEANQLEQQVQQWTENIKLQQQQLLHIQNIQQQLNSAQALQRNVLHIVQCLSAADQAQWQLHSLIIAQQIKSQLQTRADLLTQAEQLLQQQSQQQQQYSTNQQNIENNALQLQESAAALQEIKLKGQQNTETANQLIQQMTGADGIKANEWLMQFDEKRQRIQSEYQQLKHGYETLRQQFEHEKSQLDQLNAQFKQNQQNAHEAQGSIQDWLAQHADFLPEDLAQLSQISSAQEQQLRLKLQQAERQLNEANAALTTMQEQLAQHRTHQPHIDEAQLQQQFIAHQSMFSTQSELREQLKIKQELHLVNAGKLTQFAEQIQSIQQEEHRWSKISSLIGDAKGKDFREYAQQYNLDILVEYANQQLHQLSQRYTLKRLENSLSLGIIDHDMDGELRSTASLSGGESFLTALALSLAIANMASGSMKIESLFIDEGFGTLDASSLHMVMNALDQLQNQGRKVVLISHIQEMHERIPVQIQVNPLGAGASRIDIVG
ncbi:MAG: SbcC/MukB-like Walker B domain-containing protein [Acinetobacter sp.]